MQGVKQRIESLQGNLPERKLLLTWRLQKSAQQIGEEGVRC